MGWSFPKPALKVKVTLGVKFLLRRSSNISCLRHQFWCWLAREVRKPNVSSSIICRIFFTMDHIYKTFTKILQSHQYPPKYKILMQVLSISGAVKGKGRPSNENTRKDKNRNSVSVGSFSEVPELSLPKLGYGLLTKKSWRRGNSTFAWRKNTPDWKENTNSSMIFWFSNIKKFFTVCARYLTIILP